MTGLGTGLLLWQCRSEPSGVRVRGYMIIDKGNGLSFEGGSFSCLLRTWNEGIAWTFLRVC